MLSRYSISLISLLPFRVGSRKGVYHEPYADEKSAADGHVRILAAVTDGSLQFGTTVQGEQGLPLITPEEWFARQNPELTTN